MGLFDKVKNLFTEPDEPEEDEIKVEQIKREVTRIQQEPKQVASEQKREKKIELEDLPEINDIPDKEPEILEEKHEDEQKSAPIFFTDKDFDDLEIDRPKKVEKKKEIEPKPIIKKEEKKSVYGGGYTSTSLLTKEKPTFKPTPIISPIYGILDKNYTKEDIVEKGETKKEKNIEPPSKDRFDEIRSKAYGTLENDLEDTIYENSRENRRNKNKHLEDEVDLFEELEKEKDISSMKKTPNLTKTVTEQDKNIDELEEITMDLTKELDNLLLKKESYGNKKVKIEDEDEPLTENELFNLIDSMYEEGKE